MKTLRWLPFLALIITHGGCAHHAKEAAGSRSPGSRTFETRGIVREISLDRREAVIRHEPIPGYMPGMTMTFSVQHPSELEGIQPGDDVTFRLMVNDETHWIEFVRRVGQAATNDPPHLPASVTNSVAELKTGDLLPDWELLGEHGQPVHFSNFRGRALAFTFIFTRCPLPNFCPLMSKHFEQARALLKARDAAPTNWQFLTISFDPEIDKPAVLERHARLYRGKDSDRWLFAVASSDALAELAPRLGLEITRDRGSFSHNLRTVVVDTRGRVHSHFVGNQWTAEALAESVIQAAGGGNLR